MQQGGPPGKTKRMRGAPPTPDSSKGESPQPRPQQRPAYPSTDDIAAAERARAAAAALVTVRPPPNVKPGAMIGDKYRVEKELGRGGFGVVVRAVHLTLDQRVAIKVLTEGEGSTELEWAEDAARFRREAKATAALRSDHVVRVLDVDVTVSGYPYIVMEYLEGKTMHDLTWTKGPLPIEDSVDYAMQMLAALAEAHSVGIVHRDLKPANVFLAKTIGGVLIAKVLDFGVSKMLGAASQRLTRTGAVVGTVAYMAPEQMLDAKRVDGRADLWSAGLVLYEALAKSHPFGTASQGPKVVTSILNDPIPPLRTFRPEIPPPLEAVIARMLEKSPDNRYNTAREVAKELAPFGSARSRQTLDEIRRAPPPSGAAAPGAGSARGGSIAAHGSLPPPSSSRSVPPPSSKRLTGTPATPATQQRRNTLVGVVLAVVVAALITFGMAGYFLYVKPHLQKANAPASSTPGFPPPATPIPSASTDPPPMVSAETIMIPPLSSAAPTSEAKPAPKPRAAVTPAASVNPCDPPFIYDKETNMKKYKPECLN